MEEGVEVGDGDDDGAHAGGEFEIGRLGHDAAVVVEFFEISEVFDGYHAEAAVVHGLEVEVFDDEGAEVVAGDVVEELIGADAVGGEDEDEELSVLGVEGEGDGVGGGVGGVAAERHVPNHGAHVGVGGGALELAAVVEAFEPGGYGWCEVGVGVAFEQGFEGLLELVGLAVGDVGEGLEEHELGHEAAHGEAVGDVVVDGVHLGVVVVHVGLVGAVVEGLLLGLHVAQALYVVGVLEGEGILGVGEVGEDELAVVLGARGVVAAHVHEVEVVVGVEAVDVVGELGEEAVEGGLGGGKVFHLVLEDDAHVVEAFLDDVAGVLLLVVGEGYLGHVILGVVGVFGTLGGGHFVGGLFAGFFGGGGVGGGLVGVGVGGGADVGEGEGGFVAAAPVVFLLAVAPLALELLLAGGAGGGVVEVPGVVVVDGELLGGLVVGVHLCLVGRFVGFVLLAARFFFGFFLLADELADDAVDDFGTAQRVHVGEAEERVLEVDVLGVDGEFVEDVGAAFEDVDVGVVLGKCGDALRVARLGELVLAAVVVEAA